MSPALFLRIASILTLLYCAGHTSGAPWTVSDAPADMAVVAAMKSHAFNALGSQRSLWDFYVGFGWTISAYLLLQAVLLWQLGGLAKAGAPVRPAIVAILAFCLVNLALAWMFFFVLPIVLITATAICLAAALVVGPKRL